MPRSQPALNSLVALRVVLSRLLLLTVLAGVATWAVIMARRVRAVFDIYRRNRVGAAAPADRSAITRLAPGWDGAFPLPLATLAVLAARMYVGIEEARPDLFFLGETESATTAIACADYRPGPVALIHLLLRHRHCVIVFRGSDGCRDWWGNLQFEQTPVNARFPGARVHGGFRRHFERIWPRVVMPALLRLVRDAGAQTTVDRVTIVGHSMGCALACLAALEVRDAFPSAAIDAVLLASPRIGNPTFARAVEHVASVTTVVNTLDAVTGLPPTLVPGLALGCDDPDIQQYVHVGHVRSFTSQPGDAARAHSVAAYWTFLKGVAGR